MVSIYIKFGIICTYLGLLGAGHPLKDSEEACTAPSQARAIYFLSNQESNSVVAIPVASNGTLSKGQTTPTGGKGGSAVDAKGVPEGPDALGSQSALTVVENFLFAVNPGSNSLSMMRISDTDPTNLKLVGSPSILPGQFPVTVAASEKNKLVCVGSTGAVAGISCASYTPKGLQEMTSVVVFNLNQTTPPVGPVNGIAQTFFSEDEAFLYTTVKGDPATNNTGLISVLPVTDIHTCKNARDVRSSPNGTAVLFGSTVLPGTSNIFATDASFGATILKTDPCTNEVSPLYEVPIPGQRATCWAAFSQQKSSVFVTDPLVNRLVEMSPVNASILSTINLTQGVPGLIDLKIGGQFIYALSPGNGTIPAAVAVVDSLLGEEIQHFPVIELGGSKSSQGMAIFE